MGCLLTNHPPALIIGRAPLANIFDMAKTAQADFLLVQAAHTAAW
jgi:hypothetical protein